jgi:hypothetical protein
MFKFFKELFSKKETIDTTGVERIEVKRTEVKRIPVTGETLRCRLWRVQYTDTGEIFDLDPGDADAARELLISGRPIKVLGYVR